MIKGDSFKNKVFYLIQSFEKMGKRAYPRSMKTIFKGNHGEVASLFVDNEVFGSKPDITTLELDIALKELVSEKVLLEEVADSNKIFYRVISNEIKAKQSRITIEREAIDKLLIKNKGNCFFNNIEEHFYQSIDPLEIDVKSKKGIIKTTLNDNKVDLKYKSTHEYEFLMMLLRCGYINNIIAKPKDKINALIEYNDSPDFIIETYDRKIVIVEILAYNEVSRFKYIKKYNRLKNICDTFNINIEICFLYNEEWMSVTQLLERPINIRLEEEILRILNEQDEITNRDLKIISGKVYFNQLDIHQVIIKNKLHRTGSFDKIIISKNKGYLNGII